MLLGASVRAAAYSALRAGLRPVAIDLFADLDLRAVGAVTRIDAERYPEGFLPMALASPPGPWMYTGALENRPDLIDSIAGSRRLWGNDGATVKAVRDPIALAAALREAGLPCPASRLDGRGVPRDGSWLVKPIASAGGRAIRLFVDDQDEDIVEEPSYYQERIEGESLGALYLGRGNGAELLGVTEQWLGRPGAAFAYRGSLGPRSLSEATKRQVENLGRAIRAAFGLVGLFGVDLILRDGVPWPVEVNPRYTASVEVLELALGRAFLADHRLACDRDAVAWLGDGEPGRRETRRKCVGKLVVYAPRACQVPATAWNGLTFDGDPWGLPRLADVPEPGTRFRVGDPVLTLLTSGPTLRICRARLNKRLARWESRLRTSPWCLGS